MAINFYKMTKRGQFWDAVMDVGSWWLLFAGVAVGALTGVWAVAIAGVAALVLTQGRSAPTLIGKIVGGVSSLYDITSYFGDILSYSRLMALMLAGSVIAQVFNTLGAIPGNVVIFVIISLAGNTLNFALNILGCYVHDLRLQCLEFFNKFYEDGGRPFTPLAYNTKYVDVE
jgi:V/A-type H+-transporting ATPase subunit I